MRIGMQHVADGLSDKEREGSLWSHVQLTGRAQQGVHDARDGGRELEASHLKPEGQTCIRHAYQTCYGAQFRERGGVRHGLRDQHGGYSDTA